MTTVQHPVSFCYLPPPPKGLIKLGMILLVLEEEVLLEEEVKLLLVRRLLPPLRLTRGRLDGITARDKGGGGGAGTRDGYEYILVSNTEPIISFFILSLLGWWELTDSLKRGKYCIG